jgi:alpha-tubulin suppressor-like RCC1 family protein
MRAITLYTLLGLSILLADTFVLPKNTTVEGVNGAVEAIALDETGLPYLASDTYCEWDSASNSSNLCYWDGHQMVALEQGGLNMAALDLALYDGALYAVGLFTATGDGSVTSLNGVARYDLATETWSALGGGPGGSGSYHAIAVDGDGRIYVADASQDGTVHLYDGSTWSAAPASTGWINDMTVTSDGTVFIGGEFNAGDDRVLSWQAGAPDWMVVADYLQLDDVVDTLFYDESSNRLYAGGITLATSYTDDMATWQEIGGPNIMLTAMTAGADGTLYAAHGPSLQYYTGSIWEELQSTDGAIYDIVTAPGGDLYIGGAFSDAGNFIFGYTPQIITTNDSFLADVGTAVTFNAQAGYNTNTFETNTTESTFSPLTHTYTAPGIYPLRWTGSAPLGTLASQTRYVRAYDRSTPQPRVAGGRDFSLQLREDGTLWAWGDNTYGQLGIGTMGGTYDTPMQVRSDDNSSFMQDVIAIAAGGSASYADGEAFALALKSDGTLWAWGSGLKGRLGNGDDTNTSCALPVQVSGLTDVVAIAAGAAHAAALTSDGTVRSWGRSGFGGALGDGTNNDSNTPVQVKQSADRNLTDIIDIQAGGGHIVALRSDGTVWSWGSSGLLGIPSDGTHSFYARRALGGESGDLFLRNITGVEAASRSSYARKADGTLWAWGGNSSGELGDEEACLDQGINDSFNCFLPVQVHGGESGEAHLQGVEAIDAGIGYAFARRAGGELWTIGSHGSYALFGVNKTAPARVPGGQSGAAQLSSIVQAAGSGSHYLALDSSDRLWGWSGYNGNDDGQLGLGDTIDRSEPTLLYPRWIEANASAPVMQPGQSVSFEAALSETLPAESVVWAFGDGTTASGTSANHSFSEPGLYSVTVTADELGLSQTVLVRVSDPEGAIAVGNDLTYAIDVDGTLWAWGINDSSQLGDGTTTNRNTPVPIGSGSDWVEVASGDGHTLALKEGGTLWGWGLNNFGQLGDGTIAAKNTPTQIGSDNDWVAVAAGTAHTIALKSDGSLWGWGYNAVGQLGDGTTDQRNTPTKIGSDSDWAQVSAGGGHTLALKNDGSLWSWGHNDFGQLGDGTTDQRNTPTKIGSDSDWAAAVAGSTHSFALKEGGTLWAWGDGSSYGLGNGVTGYETAPIQIGSDNDWAQVAPGDRYTLALKEGGSLWAWGYNAYGQLGDGTTDNKTTPEQVGTDNDWTQVAAGEWHAVGAKADGALWAWGQNTDGQLGDGTIDQRESPIRPLISPDRGYFSLAAQTHLSTTLTLPQSYGTDTNLTVKVIDGSGAVVAYHDVGIPAGATSADLNLSAPAGAGNLRVEFEKVAGDGLIASSGHLTAEGLWSLEGGDSFADMGAIVVLDTIAPVAEALNVALTADATIITAGQSVNFSVLAEGENDPLSLDWALSDFRADPGEVLSFSERFDEPGVYSTTLTVTDNASNTKTATRTIRVVEEGEQIAAGANHTLKRDADGTLWLWGDNAKGQLGLDPMLVGEARTPVKHPDLSGVVAVAAGDNFSIILKEDGTVWSFGQNDYGQLGNGTSTTGSTYDPQQVLGGAMGTTHLEGIVEIAAGVAHVLALHKDGTLYAWGWNNSGNLGDGTTSVRHAPVEVSASTIDGAIVAIDAGQNRSLALTGGGDVYAWGRRSHDGSTESSTPYHVSDLSNITAIASGWRFNMALSSSGELYTWGENGSGQLGDGTTTDRDDLTYPTFYDVSAIAAGNEYAMAVSEGQLYTWGRNDFGQLGTGDVTPANEPVASSITATPEAIVAGNDHSFVRMAGGQWYTWGKNDASQLGGAFSADDYLATPTTLTGHDWSIYETLDASPAKRRVLDSATDRYGRLFAVYSGAGGSDPQDPSAGENELRVAVQSGGSWQHHQLLADNFSDRSSGLAIATNDQGHAVIAYTDPFDSAIFLYRSIDGGQSWQPLPALEGLSYPMELDLALDGSGQPHLVFQRYVDSKDEAVYATYEGSWQIEVVGTEANSGTSAGRNGQIVISPAGAIHYVYGGFSGDYLIHARREGPNSWQVAGLPDGNSENHTSGGFTFRVAADESLHLYYDNSTHGIVHTSSSDQGGTWTLEALVDLGSSSIEAVVDSAGHTHLLAQRSEGMDRYIVYMSNRTGQWQSHWQVVNDTAATCTDPMLCSMMEGVYLDNYQLHYNRGYDRLDMLFIDNRAGQAGVAHSQTPSQATPPSPPVPPHTLALPGGYTLSASVALRIWAKDPATDAIIAETLVSLAPGQESAAFDLDIGDHSGEVVYGYTIISGAGANDLVKEGYLSATASTAAYADETRAFTAAAANLSFELLPGRTMSGTLQMALPEGQSASVFARPAAIGATSLFRHQVEVRIEGTGAASYDYELIVPEGDGFDRYRVGYELHEPLGRTVAQGYYSSEGATPYYGAATVIESANPPASVDLQAIEGVLISGSITNETDLTKAIVTARRTDGYFTFIDVDPASGSFAIAVPETTGALSYRVGLYGLDGTPEVATTKAPAWHGGGAHADRASTFSVSGADITGRDITLSPVEATTIDLQSGWNLLSLPHKAAFESFDLALNIGLHPAIEELLSYDRNGWKHYAAKAGSFKSHLNRMGSLNSHEGFWVKAAQAGTLRLNIVPDSAAADTLPALTPGWNLVGLHKAMTPADLATQIASDSLEPVTFWTWDGGQWQVYIHDAALDTTQLPETPRIQSIAPKQGIWIHVKELP